MMISKWNTGLFLGIATGFAIGSVISKDVFGICASMSFVWSMVFLHR